MKAKPLLTNAFGENRYCGPAAIASVTDLKTQATAKAIREVSGRSFVCGTQHRDMIAALKLLGAPNRELVERNKHGYKKVTLRQTLEDLSRGIYIIASGHHYFTVDKQDNAIFVVDTMNRVPQEWGKHNAKFIRPRSIVTHLIEVFPKTKVYQCYLTKRQEAHNEARRLAYEATLAVA